MSKNSGMKIFTKFGLFTWLTIILGGLIGIVTLLMLQSVWMNLDMNTQLVIFGLLVTMFIAVSSRVSVKKVK